MKGVFLILLCSIISIIIDAQDHYELIIQLQPNESFEKIERVLNESVVSKRLLSSRMKIWKVEIAKNKFQTQATIQSLKTLNEVKFVQGNRKVELRKIEFNDPDYPDQWSLNNSGQNGGILDADIDLPESLNLIDSLGLTLTNVVVAVIDNGFDLTHSDINYWINENEIPDNNIDDDLNGYIDDYYGWNAYDDTSSIPVGSHGTHVAGIISAISNNNFGIAGISNQISILPIAGSSSDESTVIAAYSYALEMKLQYLETNGEKGANIVVTNSSFGVDKGNQEDYPIWSALYDSLGKYGVLSCAATANSTWDVDEVGDMPTACTSDYLIAVTNTTSSDQKNTSAAYGKISIDLGAPGTAIYSSIPTNSFGFKTGTSMASPITAGCAAFLFALQIIDEVPIDTKPQLVKTALINGTDQITDLTDKTVSNGRLNLFNSINEYLNQQQNINVNYKSGWNIVSIPNTLAEARNNIFTQRSSNIFEYNNSYNIVESVKYGVGYWIKFEDEVTETFEKGFSDYSVVVKPGWNLIGAKDSVLSVENLATTPAGIINSPIYEFNNGYHKVENLEPGNGYWVNVTNDGIVYESTALFKQQNILLDDIDFKIDFTASTDQSNSQLLTIGFDSTATNGLDSQLGEQELPPPPPSDIFFIRFSLPDSFIESYSDIRFGELKSNYTYEHELKFQLGENATQLILNWEQPQGVEIKIQDMFGGLVISEQFAEGANEFVLTNTNITSLKLIVSYSNITSVNEDQLPQDYKLYQNYPNPFNPSTIIKISIPTSPFNPSPYQGEGNSLPDVKAGERLVSLIVYDILGREVKTLLSKPIQPGNYEVEFDGSDLPSGVYFYRITAGSFIDTKKMLLIK